MVLKEKEAIMERNVCVGKHRHCHHHRTFLKPELSVSIPKYRLVRLDRTGPERGGVATALRHNINCRLLPSLQVKLVEAV